MYRSLRLRPCHQRHRAGARTALWRRRRILVWVERGLPGCCTTSWAWFAERCSWIFDAIDFASVAEIPCPGGEFCGQARCAQPVLRNTIAKMSGLEHLASCPAKPGAPFILFTLRRRPGTYARAVLSPNTVPRRSSRKSDCPSFHPPYRANGPCRIPARPPGAPWVDRE